MVAFGCLQCRGQGRTEPTDLEAFAALFRPFSRSAFRLEARDVYDVEIGAYELTDRGREASRGSESATLQASFLLASMKASYVVQISDSHVGAAWAACDPVAGLAATVAEIRRLPRDPDAVVVTGDLSENGAEAEYEIARKLLAQIDAPVHVLAGNRDDRAGLRRCFDLSGAAGSPVQYAVDVGPLRLILIDTTRPGTAAGELDEDRLAWLDSELAVATGRTTIVAMHHPPLVTGSPAWDAIGLPRAGRHGLAEVARRHPHMRLIASGHVHRAIVGSLDGCPVLTAPSTFAQAEPGLGASQLEFAPGPIGFAIHAAVNGELVSQIRVIDQKTPHNTQL